MKVLVISHNPLCTYNGMGKTLASLLSSFGKEELCQLYIYPSYPDIDLCSSYFRITDKDVLRSLTTFKEPGGEVEKSLITQDQPPFESEKDETLYHNAKNKSPFRRLARDGIWRVGRWYGKHLKAWLDKEAPDVIFAAPGPARFLYDIAMRISSERKIPIAAYFCDEYYFVHQERSAMGRLRQRLLKGKIEAFLAKTDLLVTISEELKKVYSDRFGIPCRVIMTGSTSGSAENGAANKPTERLSYFGNVRSGRYMSLRQIGDALDELGAVRGKEYLLDVYSFENDPGILRVLTEARSIRLRGFVQGKEFAEAFRDSQLLLHAESFDPEMMDRVKHSVSTKIADSLASGIPLFAYGPGGLSSIEHLKRNHCAFVCTDPGKLREMLDSAMNDTEARKRISEDAVSAAAKYHDPGVNSRQLYAALAEIGGDRE